MEAAPDFRLEPAELVQATSEGGWASCTTCHELIAKSDWHGLEKRGVEAMSRVYPFQPREIVVLSVRSIQRQFRLHRQVS
jgi:hypothetical protein